MTRMLIKPWVNAADDVPPYFWSWNTDQADSLLSTPKKKLLKGALPDLLLHGILKGFFFFGGGEAAGLAPRRDFQSLMVFIETKF